MSWVRTGWFKLLLVGIASVWLSDLVFAWGILPRFAALLVGLALVAVAWVALARAGWRSGLGAAGVVVAAAVLWGSIAPVLRQQSFRMFLDRHRGALERAVVLLEPVRARFTSVECVEEMDRHACAQLAIVQEEFGGFAWKDGDATFVRFHGFLDGGLLHFTGDPPVAGPFEHFVVGERITGDWYRWSPEDPAYRGFFPLPWVDPF